MGWIPLLLGLLLLIGAWYYHSYAPSAGRGQKKWAAAAEKERNRQKKYAECQQSCKKKYDAEKPKREHVYGSNWERPHQEYSYGAGYPTRNQHDYEGLNEHGQKRKKERLVFLRNKNI